jgi:hypothetical protein
VDIPFEPNPTTLRPAFASALLLIPLAASAVNPTLQPISTRFAQTQSDISIELIASTFTDLDLEEEDDFDGWTASVEIVVPLETISERMQLRFSLPFYTDGDARITDETKPNFGDKTDIDGYGGVYDFVTLQFEHQWLETKTSGFNAAYAVGFGAVLVPLDTTALDIDLTEPEADDETDPEATDLMNHEGYVFLTSLKFDRPVSIFGEESQLLLNGGMRGYFYTDDLHPDDQDHFIWADLKGAVIFEQLGNNVVPVLELTYLGDFGDFDELLLKPEVIIPFNESASLKFGGLLSLSDEGNQGGFAGSLSFSF